MSSSSRESTTIPALDGLRGLAAIGVLLFHDGRLSGGFLGVDLFFAMSGMLITGLLIEECNRHGTVDRHRFWSRRFRRLLPAMSVMLIAIIPMMRLWGSPTQLDDARHGVIPGMFYVSNWQHVLHHADYWGLFTDPSPLTHLWSLAVEGQFYVVWPLFVLLVAKLPNWRVKLGWLTALGVVTSGVLMWVLFDPAFPTRAYEGTDTRAASILVGALAAIVGLPALIRSFAEHYHAVVQVAQVAVVAGLAWLWITIPEGAPSWLYHGGFVLHSTVGAVLAASLGVPRPTVVQRVLANGVLRWTGLVSYGLYLWHWPVYVVLSEQRGRDWGIERWQLSLLRWGVTVAVTAVSYYLLEMPVRHRTLFKGRAHAPMAFVASLAVIIAAIVLVPRPETAPAAFDPGSLSTSTAPATTSPASTAPATTVSTVPGATTTTAAPTTTLPRRAVHTVYWEGDSVAFDEAPGVLAALTAAGLQAEEHTAVGLGLTNGGANFADVVVKGRPDLVIVQISGWDALKGTPEQQKAAIDTYTAAALGAGAAIVFVTPPPTDPAKPEVAVHFEVMLGFARDLAAQHPGEVWVLDANADLWGAFAYDVDGDGAPDRKKDGVHVCPQGSARLGNWLVSQLATIFDGVAPADPTTWAGGTWVNDPRFDNPPGTCR